MFMSIPFEPRQVRATEARLERIYEGARLGLKKDRLAMYAGMLPIEFNQLKQLDPAAELAELKGRVDAEAEMANVLRKAALGGDAKAALSVLQHQHEWEPKHDSGAPRLNGGGGITIVIGEVTPPHALTSKPQGITIDGERVREPIDV